MTSPGMCRHKAISEGTGDSFTKGKGVLMKRHVLKYPLHQPPLHCYWWFDMEGEAAVLHPFSAESWPWFSWTFERGGQWQALSAWPVRPSALPLLCSGLTGSGLQHGFIAPMFKSHLSPLLVQRSLQTFSLERKEGRGWFWDWGPGLAFRNCSAAAPLHSVKHAVYLLSFLCPSALAQGAENEKSAVETLGLLQWVAVSRYTRDVVMSMDLLVEGGRATNRVESLPFLMLHVCF